MTPDPRLVGRIGDNLAALRERIRRAGGERVTIVGVTKRQPPEAVAAALGAGVVDLGENYAQELRGKAVALGEGFQPSWHFVGRIQTNKVRLLTPYVRCYQSVDRESVVAALARHHPGARMLVQVDLAGIPGRGGCSWDAAGALVEHATAAGLRVEGLMGVGPPEGTAGSVGSRSRLFERLRRMVDGLGLSECSMGMSGDLDDAVAAGATMVRIGTALFGARG